MRLLALTGVLLLALVGASTAQASTAPPVGSELWAQARSWPGGLTNYEKYQYLIRNGAHAGAVQFADPLLGGTLRNYTQAELDQIMNAWNGRTAGSPPTMPANLGTLADGERVRIADRATRLNEAETANARNTRTKLQRIRGAAGLSTPLRTALPTLLLATVATDVWVRNIRNGDEWWERFQGNAGLEDSSESSEAQSFAWQVSPPGTTVATNNRSDYALDNAETYYYLKTNTCTLFYDPPSPSFGCDNTVDARAWVMATTAGATGYNYAPSPSAGQYLIILTEEEYEAMLAGKGQRRAPGEDAPGTPAATFDFSSNTVGDTTVWNAGKTSIAGDTWIRNTIDPDDATNSDPDADPTPDPTPDTGTGTGPVEIIPPATTVPSAPAVDFSPVTDIDFGCKFPYGFLCYAVDFTEQFDVAADAPVFTFDMEMDVALGSFDLGTYEVDLNVMDDWMALWRDILSVVMVVGAIYFVATRMLGFKAGGDPGAAMDDVL